MAVPYHNMLSPEEVNALEEKLGMRYLQCWGDEFNQLHAILQEKKWFAFDLDDTLHEFRLASGKATTAVLDLISAKFGVKDTNMLREEYKTILKEKTSNAFSDGKTSHDYRGERFTSLLNNVDLPADSSLISTCLDVYENTLMQSLQLKCGALELLRILKRNGKSIAIITEGPQDAQERTIKALGIHTCIDFLATTNFFRVSKTDGLFQKVLTHLRISSEDVAYIGDSQERDIIPAKTAGIFSIYLDEKRHITLNVATPRINNLRKLEHIILSKEVQT